VATTDERSFPRGEEFIPERWTTRPELVRDASIYAPFSTGRFSCVGKQLALMEIRRTTAIILHGYDLRIAPGQDVDAFPAKMKDTFTLVAPDFHLVFNARPAR
jgi:cytochrome P450 family 628